MEEIKTFGKYQLLRRLAVGGMAEIFLARRLDDPSSPPIVIKRILSYRADDREFVQMFLEEAELSSLLEHPNIVKIFDWGEAEGHYYMAMEYIDGLDLSQLLEFSTAKGEKIPLYIVAGIIAQAAEGLHFAHHYRHPQTGEPLNLVHRDISPPNIMVSRGGNVKLLDFGIAKASSSVSRRDPTKTGILKGKLAYMSPEYLRGDPIDGRHDLFALGVVMYELATGEKPFEGKRDVQVLQGILMQPPRDPRQFVPDLPPKFISILNKMLEKEPADRFQTGLQVKEALQEFLLESGYLEITPQTIANYIAPFLPVAGESFSPTEGFEKSQRSQVWENRENLEPYFNPQEISNPRYSPPQHSAPSAEREAPEGRKEPGPSTPPFMDATPPFGFQNRDEGDWYSEETKAISLDQVKLEQHLNPQSEETAVINLEALREGNSVGLQPPLSDLDGGDLPTSEVGRDSANDRDESESGEEQESIPTPSQFLENLPQEPREDDTPSEPKSSLSVKTIAIIALSILVLAGGGFLGWLQFYHRGGDTEADADTSSSESSKLPAKVEKPKKTEATKKQTRSAVKKGPSKSSVRKNINTIKKKSEKREKVSKKGDSAEKKADLPSPLEGREIDRKVGGFQGVYLSTRPSCFVFWKKKNLGQTPGFFALPHGRHKLYLRKSRPYILYPVTIVIPKGRKVRRFISVPEAYLTIRTSHPAKLIIDGYVYGTINSRRTIRLYAGYHKISVRAIGGNFRRSQYSDWIFLEPRRRKNLSFTFF